MNLNENYVAVAFRRTVSDDMCIDVRQDLESTWSWYLVDMRRSQWIRSGDGYNSSSAAVDAAERAWAKIRGTARC